MERDALWLADRLLHLMNRVTQTSAVISALGFLIMSASSTLAQTPPASPGLRGIPASLRSSLSQRIHDFTEAQRQGKWDRAGELLGKFRGSAHGRQYTNGHRQCLIEQMKSAPMVGFAPVGVGYSTEILSRPLSEKWWYIRGSAEFTREGHSVKGEATIIAYRYQGQWFFTPPNYDDESESKIRAQDLAADLSNYLKVEIAPDCPLEMTRLSVKVNARYRSLRNITFDLRNKSRKEVHGLGFRIAKADGKGSMSSGMPFRISPGATTSSPDNISYSGYVYYCEGESLNRFIIDWVSFSDGTKWNLKVKKVTRRRKS